MARALATALVVPRLEVFDLSMGITTDAGVLALLGGQPLTHLRRLNLSHHYMNEDLMAAIPGLLPDVEVDLSDRQTTDESNWRYAAVSE